MVNHGNLKDLFTDIANAIRSRTGSTTDIVADNFPEAIREIETHNIEDAIISRTLQSYTNDRITQVGHSAFYACYNLSYVELPNVSHIDDHAFVSCQLLRTVVCPSVGAVEHGAFNDCTLLSKVVAPKISHILSSAFGACHSLRKMDIAGEWDLGGGEFVGGAIGQYAFSHSGLESLIIRSPNGGIPSLVDNAFDNSPIGSGTGYIYVPAVLVDSYKTHPDWSIYASQIRAIEDYPEICGV